LRTRPCAWRCDVSCARDSDAGHAAETKAFFTGQLEELAAVLVSENELREIVGFAELSIRFDVAGLEGQQTGSAEWLFVQSAVRGSGTIEELSRASPRRARDQECEAFASDRAKRVIVDGRF